MNFCLTTSATIYTHSCHNMLLEKNITKLFLKICKSIQFSHVVRERPLRYFCYSKQHLCLVFNLLEKTKTSWRFQILRQNAMNRNCQNDHNWWFVFVLLHYIQIPGISAWIYWDQGCMSLWFTLPIHFIINWSVQRFFRQGTMG